MGNKKMIKDLALRVTLLFSEGDCVYLSCVSCPIILANTQMNFIC